MMRPGELLAGRFELIDDEEEVVEYRRWLTQWIRQDNVDEQRLWVRVVDRVTGRSAVYSPPIADACEVSSTAERVARDVMALGLAAVVPVLHGGPGVVYAEPPPVVPRPTLTLAEAAALALSACEVVAHVHAVGYDELSFGPRHLRMTADERGWRVAWLIPTVPALARLDAPRVPTRAPRVESPELTDQDISALFGDDPVEPVATAAAQQGLAGLFFSLIDRAVRDDATLARLAEIREGKAWEADVDGLARLFLTMVSTPAVWTSRVDALAELRVAPRRPRDWDAKIADLERAIAGLNTPQTAIDLAWAYHQRACRSFAAGELQAALADAERAFRLDRSVGHQTTRAVILDRLGQPAVARADVADACARAGMLQLGGPNDERLTGAYDEVVSRPDFARALATAALFEVLDGEFAWAEPRLRTSLELHPTAAAAHALGAVLYRRGEVEEAAAFEALSVELEPTNVRHRWALVVSLLRLGRVDEAREHGLAVIRGEPDEPAHRARFARLLGG